MITPFNTQQLDKSRGYEVSDFAIAAGPHLFYLCGAQQERPTVDRCGDQHLRRESRKASGNVAFKYDVIRRIK
ncbi:hypothetical protein VCR17J2_350265 [Vibrio coralliirubri]|nr:hypothetical protein VCR17J2_350265 [Vibrio coralliirubri]